jgi:hypothetical protein
MFNVREVEDSLGFLYVSCRVGVAGTQEAAEQAIQDRMSYSLGSDAAREPRATF